MILGKNIYVIIKVYDMILDLFNNNNNNLFNVKRIYETQLKDKTKFNLYKFQQRY